MAYSENDHTERIISETHNKVSLAIRFMLEDIHRTSTRRTPKKTGQLRADIRKNVTGSRGKITWGKHYAWYQERGYTSGKVRRYTTPGTGKHFAEDAVKAVVKKSGTYFKRAGLTNKHTVKATGPSARLARK